MICPKRFNKRTVDMLLAFQEALYGVNELGLNDHPYLKRENVLHSLINLFDIHLVFDGKMTNGDVEKERSDILEINFGEKAFVATNEQLATTMGVVSSEYMMSVCYQKYKEVIAYLINTTTEWLRSGTVDFHTLNLMAFKVRSFILLSNEVHGEIVELKLKNFQGKYPYRPEVSQEERFEISMIIEKIFHVMRGNDTDSLWSGLRSSIDTLYLFNGWGKLDEIMEGLNTCDSYLVHSSDVDRIETEMIYRLNDTLIRGRYEAGFELLFGGLYKQLLARHAE